MLSFFLSNAYLRITHILIFFTPKSVETNFHLKDTHTRSITGDVYARSKGKKIPRLIYFVTPDNASQRKEKMAPS